MAFGKTFGPLESPKKKKDVFCGRPVVIHVRIAIGHIVINGLRWGKTVAMGSDG